MNHPNRAMVNAAHSLMEEYGDAMSEAVFNVGHAPAKTNPGHAKDGAMKIILGGAALAAAVYVLRRREIAPAL